MVPVKLRCTSGHNSPRGAGQFEGHHYMREREKERERERGNITL